MAKAENKRKNYFIKKKFQAKFMLKFCFLVVLGAAITGAILYFFSADTVTTAFVNSRLSIVNTSDYILPILIGSSLISIALISIATAFAIMYISHRIAGPLFNIEKSIGEIGEGNLNLKINLRSTDEVIEMANRLNEMTGSIRERVRKIKNCVNDLTGQIDNLNNLLKDNNTLPDQARGALQELLKNKEQLKKETEYFRTN